VVATLDGQLLFFDVRTSTQVASIEGRNDLGSGRKDTDLITAKKNLQSKYNNSPFYNLLLINIGYLGMYRICLIIIQ